MRHVCGVKMRIAPCEVEMFCPKCGLIKENGFFLQALMGDTEKSKKQKQKKNYYLLIRVKYFFTTQRSCS